MHRAAGGFGTLNVWQRSVISIPYPKPDGDFSLLIGDWYRRSHRVIIYISSGCFHIQKENSTFEAMQLVFAKNWKDFALVCPYFMVNIRCSKVYWF